MTKTEIAAKIKNMISENLRIPENIWTTMPSCSAATSAWTPLTPSRSFPASTTCSAST